MFESYKVTKLHFEKHGNKKIGFGTSFFFLTHEMPKKHFDTIVIS